MKTTIITNKKTEYSIIIPQKCSLVEKTAAAQQAKQLDCIFLIKWYNRCAQVKIK